MEHLKKRLLARITKQDNGCWIWQGACRSGYGAIRVGAKVCQTHRLSYTLFKGNIPDGLLVCHTCDTKKCINPEHLFVGTHKDNMADCVNKGRISRLIPSRCFEKGNIPPNRKYSEESLQEVLNRKAEYPEMSWASICRELGFNYNRLREYRSNHK